MNKLIVKFAALLTMAALMVWTIGPAFANSSQTATTGLTRVAGGGANPIVKAKWEMKDLFQLAPGVGEAGKDDSANSGAQFLPTGVWGDRAPSDRTGEMKYSICAIVTDPDGVSDINGVYTDIFYPATIAAHQGTHPNLDNVLGGQQGGTPNPTTPDLVTNTGVVNSPDYDHGNLYGCADPVEDENQLTKLSKADGIALFCNNIQGSNNNLPTFFPIPGTSNPVQYYTYSEICGTTGELEKETAYVYCADKHLEWEDPAGNYKVEILAVDKSGGFSFTGPSNLNYYYEYLPLTSFEKDFTSVAYGNVQLNTHKRIAGDLTWDGVNSNTLRPSIRNTGNTRLYMGINQTDLGLGTTDGVSNVKFDARVGSEELDWRYYWPNTHQWLEDILDLSEVEEMDFSILVTKFPSTTTTWGGSMTLDVLQAPHRQCSN